MKSSKFLLYPIMLLIFFATIGCDRINTSDASISASFDSLDHNESKSCNFTVAEDISLLSLDGSISIQKGALRIKIYDSEQNVLYDKKYDAAALRSIKIPLSDLKTDNIYTFEIISLDESEGIELTLSSDKIMNTDNRA